MILPCRNGGAFLHIAVESILQQSFSDFELLFLDDGSTDDSLEIVKKFNDPRILIFSDGLSLGLAARLNQGVRHAKGRLIARMDADDISFPSRLEKQVQFLEQHPGIDLVGCKAIAFTSDGNVLGLLPFQKDHEAICKKLWNNIPLPHPTWLGKKEWFKKNQYRIPDVYRAEDQELLLRAYSTSYYACLNEVLLGYRAGQFQPIRILRTRFSLFRVQLKYFLNEKNFLSIIYASCVTSIKIFADIISTLLRSDRWYSRRMKKNISPILKDELFLYITMYQQNNKK